MLNTLNSRAPIEVFLSYAHEDEDLKQDLIKHLSGLKLQGIIMGWHDRQISPGSEWEREINLRLNTSQIILLLISKSFMSSDYCIGIEMKRSIERHLAGKARVIPIILRPCDWMIDPIRQLQALPINGKPITSWEQIDEAFLNVVQGIRMAISQLEGTKQSQQHKTHGETLLQQGDFNGAWNHFQQALVLDQQFYGLNHPLIGWDYNNLGRVLAVQGNSAGAWEYYKNALNIAIAAYGNKHPDVAVALNHFGYLFFQTRRYPEAMYHYREALTINQEVFGKQHPTVAFGYQFIGLLLEAQGDLSNAYSYLKHALEIYRINFGLKHAYVAASYASLGDIERLRSHKAEAKKYYEYALKIYREILGKEHPQTLEIQRKRHSLLGFWDKLIE